MISLVIRSNRIDERGRKVKGSGEGNLISETPPGCWRDCPNLNNRISRRKDTDGSSRSIHKYLEKLIRYPKYRQDFHPSRHALMITIIFIAFARQIDGANTHQPFEWVLARVTDSKVLNKTVVSGAPMFKVTNCDLLGPTLGEDVCTPQRYYSWGAINVKASYWCPSSNPGKSYCNYPGYFYCAYWGCETVATGWKVSTEDKYLTVQWGPEGCVFPTYDYSGSVNRVGTCKYLLITVKQPEDPGWVIGRTWGVMLWLSGADKGGFIMIKKQGISYDSPLPLDPNTVLAPLHTPTRKTLSSSTLVPSITHNELRINHDMFSDSLWEILQASFTALNKTQPNLTKNCWLCYNVKPPYYEAIGEPNEVRWSNGTNPAECPWDSNHTQGLTIQQVTGKGKCIGTISRQYRSLCNSTISEEKIGNKTRTGFKWLIPTKGAKWVCSDIGVTPCISLNVFNKSEFCIQVVIIPRLTYHTDEEIMYETEGDSFSRHKREPVTAITLATLLLAGGVGAGTGIASLVKSGEIQNLQHAVDEDLNRIEQSVDKLATSIKPLSEVVLQNRRGLDLLFLKEGGLCVALREECCSFIDHTGVVKDSMAELRKRLEQRRKERESGKSWYEGWFTASPWLTSLLSALAGPLIIIMLGLIFGPCIIRYLSQMMKKRFDMTKLLILTQLNSTREI